MSVRHIIGRQTIRLQTDRYQGAHQVQQAVSKAYWQHVVPVLERIFDRHAGPGVWIRLDSLEIDLGPIDLTLLEKVEFESLVAEKVEKALLEAIRRLPPHQAEGRPTALHQFDLWLWWLQHGSLPWYSAAPDAAWFGHVLKTLGLEQKAVDKLGQLARQHPEVIRRIVLQHEPTFLKAILELHTGQPQAAFLRGIQELTSALATSDSGINGNDIRALEIRYWETALRETIQFQRKWDRASLIQLLRDDTMLMPAIPALKKLFRKKNGGFTEIKGLFEQTGLIEKPGLPAKKTAKPDPPGATDADASSPESFQSPVQETDQTATSEQTIHNILSDAPGSEREKQPVQRADQQMPEQKPAIPDRRVDVDSRDAGETDQYFIQNAGIVLLHTFLPRFFSNLGLLEQQAFKNEAARHRAVVLLHFLATGVSHTPDYNLVLPKFLCAMPVNMPLDHTIEPTPDEQEEATQLLQAAIAHWGALGATSPDGLREGFLQRPGKLSHTDTGWRLQVEQNTIDILLDRLPWNLGMIKLPWMPELLRVEWR